MANVSPGQAPPGVGVLGPGEGVGDRVEVGADVEAVEPVVVAGVDDDGDVGGVDDLDQPAEEARRPHPTRQRRDHARERTGQPAPGRPAGPAPRTPAGAPGSVPVGSGDGTLAALMSTLEPPDAPVPVPAEDEPPRRRRGPATRPPTSTVDAARRRAATASRRRGGPRPVPAGRGGGRHPQPGTLARGHPRRARRPGLRRPHRARRRLRLAGGPHAAGRRRCCRGRSSAASTRAPASPTAANEALHAVEGATFLLLCHDDVVLDPTAVRLLVEEALPLERRASSGPKLVERRRTPRSCSRSAGPSTASARRTPASSRASSTRSSTTACATSSTSRPRRCSCAPTCSRSSAASTPRRSPVPRTSTSAGAPGSRVRACSSCPTRVPRTARRPTSVRAATGPTSSRSRARAVRVLFTSYSLRHAAVAGAVRVRGRVHRGDRRPAHRASAPGAGRHRQLVLQPAARAPPPRRRAGARRQLAARCTTPSCASCRSRAPPRLSAFLAQHLHTDTRLRVHRRRVAERGRLRVRRRAHARRDRVPRVPRARRRSAPAASITARGPGHRHVRSLAGRRRPVRQLRLGVALHRARFGVARARRARADRRAGHGAPRVRSGSRRP